MMRGSVPSRWLSIVLLVALLAAAAPFPGAEGQFGSGGELRTEPLLADAQPFVEVLSDPEGDTEFTLAGAAPLPAADAGDAYAATADIVSLKVAENQEAIVLALQHRDYPTESATASQVVLGQNLWCTIIFQINSEANRYYEIDLRSEDFMDGGDYQSRAYMYMREQDTANPDYYGIQGYLPLWAAMIDYDHFEIAMDKQFLVVGSDRRELRIGDALTDMDVQCSRSAALGVQYRDEAGGEAAPSTPYEISAATRSGELAIGFQTAEHGLTVAPDGATKLNVHIHNLYERKLLVNVTATLTDMDGAPLAGWSVEAAPTFELKSNDTLPASLIIRPPGDAQHRDGGFLTIRAIPLGFDHHVQVTKRVSVVVSPTAEQNTLYFHDSGTTYSYCVLICDDVLPDLGYGPNQFVMNTLPTDPDLGETDTEKSGVAVLSYDATWVSLDAPLGHDLRFDPDGVFEFTMSLRSDVERDIRLSGYLYGDEEFFGTFDTTAAVGPSFSTHTVQFAPTAEDLKARAGTRLEFEIIAREATLNFFGSTWIDPVDWRPAETSLTLPLLSTPTKTLDITDGRALPTLALSNDTDAEQYLNPGDTQAFDLLLVNEGRDKDVVGLKADVPEGWFVSLYPGDQFNLEPGSSAPVCASITAPEDALDSETVSVNLTAWSRSDPDVRTTTELTLIVVDLDVEEDSCPDRDPDDYTEPFTEREKTTPGVALPAFLGVLALLGVALRRRL